MTFNNLVPDPLSPESAYVPRVFGFRVHQSALRQGGGAGSGGSGGGGITHAPLPSNGRRGAGVGAGGAITYPQRMGNVSSTRATEGSSRNNSGGVVGSSGGTGGLPLQEVVKDEEGRDGDSNNEEADISAEVDMSTAAVPANKTEAEIDGETAAEVVGGVPDAMAEKDASKNEENGNVNSNASKKREIIEEGKKSGSSSGLKRPRRGGEAVT